MRSRYGRATAADSLPTVPKDSQAPLLHANSCQSWWGATSWTDGSRQRVRTLLRLLRNRRRRHAANSPHPWQRARRPSAFRDRGVVLGGRKDQCHACRTESDVRTRLVVRESARRQVPPIALRHSTPIQERKWGREGLRRRSDRRCCNRRSLRTVFRGSCRVDPG